MVKAKGTNGKFPVLVQPVRSKIALPRCYSLKKKNEAGQDTARGWGRKGGRKEIIKYRKLMQMPCSNPSKQKNLAFLAMWFWLKSQGYKKGDVESPLWLTKATMARQVSGLSLHRCPESIV